MEEGSSANTLLEKDVNVFYHAVKKGNLKSVMQVIGNNSGRNLINMENVEGKNTLEVAMESNNYEIAIYLIENGFKLKTTLLRIIETDNPIAVTFICEHKDLIQKCCHDIMESPPENDEYTKETTPILLAAEKNNYRIVEVLLKYGASMPTYEEFISRYTHIPASELTSITYRYYNAITSEAYLLQTKGNLVTDIFSLFKHLKRAKYDTMGMSGEFEQLTAKLERVARKVLHLSRNKEEVRCLLAGDNDAYQSSRHLMPRVIKDAMQLDMKGFIAHGKCQEVLVELWYQHLHSDLRHSVGKRIIATVLLTILNQFLCILYVIVPCETFRRFMNVPYVKFIMYTASRMIFLFLLIFAAFVESKQDPLTPDATDEEIREGYLIFRNAKTSEFGYTVIVIVWILGMSLRELSNARRMGRKMYMKIGCNMIDIVQLGLYWISIVFRLVAFVQAHQTVGDQGWIRCQRPPSIPPSIVYASTPHPSTSCRDCNPSTSQLSLRVNWHDGDNVTSGNISTKTSTAENSPDSRTMDGEEDEKEFEVEKPCPQIPIVGKDHGFTKHVRIFGSQTRYDLTSFDPLLVAEAAFALANVLTFGRLLQTVVMVSGRLGVLAISITGMVGDIVKFLILFSMAWISFTLGMTQLYRPFDELKLQECQISNGGSLCPTPAFISIFDSMKTLFWALFGLHNLEDLQIKRGELGLTEAVGHFMYALYLLVAVIVLLNALIAMMSSTYARVQENAEMEWKYVRSTNMTEYIIEGAVLPPPFNLIPDTWHFLCYSSQRRKEETNILKNHHNRFQETCTSVTKRYIYELQREQLHRRLTARSNDAKLI